MKKAVCVISGGMDSATCAYIAKARGYEIYALHFDYNQRTMRKERECFERICADLGVKNSLIINADFIAQMGANALTDPNIAIPKDSILAPFSHTKPINPPVTYVPFRNGIFLSIAAAYAEIHSCEAIFIGVVEEDSSGYPDCCENFIKSMQNTINLGRAKHAEILTPLIHLSKGEIVKKAIEVGAKLEFTWSCYENEVKACGKCDSCKLRLKGFKEARLKDPISYENE